MNNSGRHDKLVLIVEDEPDNQEIMRAVVEDILGYKAQTVGDGAAALPAAAGARPNLILMDLMLPVLDGFEAIRRLKASKETSHIPIVAVTALGRNIDRQRALAVGADDYLVKPFDLDLLLKKIVFYSTGYLSDSNEQYATLK